MMTHYQVLGVHNRSGQADIRAAYLGLMKRVHPDSGNGSGSGAADADIYRINQAYAVLRDIAKRAEYDAELLRQHQAREWRAWASLPPPRPRSAGRIAATLLLAAGSIGLLTADTMLPAAPEGPTVTAATAAAAAALLPKARAATAAAEAAVEGPDLDPGIEDVVSLAAAVSLVDARTSSMRCFFEVQHSRDASAADRCIAFDLAFSYWHDGEFRGRDDEYYFSPTVVQRRHQRALAAVSPDEPFHRLDAIRAKTFSTLVDMLAKRNRES